MAKKSWIDRVRAEPAAAAALAVFALAAATLAGAWYFQLVVGLPPCPLCLEERIPYHVVIPLALLVAIAALSARAAKTRSWSALSRSSSRCCAMSRSAPITPASNGIGGPARPIAPGR